MSYLACDHGPRMWRAIGVALVYASLAHAEPSPPPIPRVDTHWSVALALGAESLTPTAAASTTESIGYLEAAARYRLVFNTELQLALDLGGRADAKLGALFLDVRYRFNPEDAWRWSLGAGLGLASVAAPDRTLPPPSYYFARYGMTSFGFQIGGSYAW